MDESNIPSGLTGDTRTGSTEPAADASKSPLPFPRAVAAGASSEERTFGDDVSESQAADEQRSERLARDWIDRAAGVAHRAIDGLAGKATAAVDSVGGGASKAVGAKDEWLESARDAIREQPLAAFGIAALIGAGLVALTSGRRR